MIPELKGREKTSWSKLVSYTSPRVMPWVQLRHLASNNKMEGNWSSHTYTCTPPHAHAWSYTYATSLHTSEHTPSHLHTHIRKHTHTHERLPFVLFLVPNVSVIKVTNLDGSQKSICKWLRLNSYHPWCYLNISIELLKHCSYRWLLKRAHWCYWSDLRLREINVDI